MGSKVFKPENVLFESPSTSCRRSLITLLTVVGVCFVIPALLAVFNFFPMPIVIIMIIIFICCFIFTEICLPHKFILTDTHFIIKRRLRNSVIPLQNIKAFNVMSPERTKKFIRTGDYSDAKSHFVSYPTKYKKTINYARRWDGWTILVTDAGRFLITPDDLQIVDAAILQINRVRD